MRTPTPCGDTLTGTTSFCLLRTAAGVLAAALTLLGCADPVFIVTTNDPARTYAGYTYFQSDYFTPGVFCVDMQGNLQWKRFSATGIQGALLGLDVMENGNVIANLRGFPQIFDPVTDTLVWEDRGNLVHHALFATPWNTVMFIGSDRFTVPDYAPWKRCVIYGDVIDEVDMNTHQVVWQWFLRDHVDPVQNHWDGMCDPPSTSADWAHSNTLKYYPGYVYQGQSHDVLLLNSRHLDTFWMIDYPSGEILWSCGQHGTFGRQEPPAEPIFSWAHEVDLLPNGNFILYDNGNERAVQVSRALEIAVDPVARTVEEVWSWTEGHYDYGMGDADRLPNGNTLLTNVVNAKLIEVDSLGEKVWEMKMRSRTNPANETANTIYKAIRVTRFGPP